MSRQIMMAGLLILPPLALSTPEDKLPKPPNGRAKYSVYLPPGYSSTRAEKYPVLYL